MKYFEEEEEEKRRNVARCSIATIQSFARGKRRGEGEREEDKRGGKEKYSVGLAWIGVSRVNEYNEIWRWVKRWSRVSERSDLSCITGN